MSTNPEVDRDAVAQKVIETIAEQKGLPESAITLKSNFEELGVDSLDAAEILFEMEDHFDTDIPDGPARAMRTVRQVVDGLVTLLSGEEIEVPEPPASEQTPSTEEPRPSALGEA